MNPLPVNGRASSRAALALWHGMPCEVESMRLFMHCLLD